MVYWFSLLLFFFCDSLILGVNLAVEVVFVPRGLRWRCRLNRNIVKPRELLG